MVKIYIYIYTKKGSILNSILPNNYEILESGLANLDIRTYFNRFLNDIYVYLYSSQPFRNNKQIPFKYNLLDVNNELIPEHINSEILICMYTRNWDNLISAVTDSKDYLNDKDNIALLLYAYILNSDDKAIFELLKKKAIWVNSFIELVKSTKDDDDLFNKLKNTKWNNPNIASVIMNYWIRNIILSSN